VSRARYGGGKLTAAPVVRGKNSLAHNTQLDPHAFRVLAQLYEEGRCGATHLWYAGAVASASCSFASYRGRVPLACMVLRWACMACRRWRWCGPPTVIFRRSSTCLGWRVERAPTKQAVRGSVLSLMIVWAGPCWQMPERGCCVRPSAPASASIRCCMCASCPHGHMDVDGTRRPVAHANAAGPAWTATRFPSMAPAM
jgi:hypothetical protein